MLALTVAFFTAALALAGNILAGLWRQYLERRGIAAALAGEIGAYMKLLNPPTTAKNFRAIAALDEATRRRRLGSMLTKTPEGHPVFDKVAGKIGLLPVAEALDVSAIYNIVSGMRIILSGLSTEKFVAADAEMQIANLNYIADTFEQQHQPAQDLVRRLTGISNEPFWQFRWLRR
jgi:hypothetical protein